MLEKMAHYLRMENLFRSLLHTGKKFFQMNQGVKYKKSRQRDNVSEFLHDSQEGKDF